MGFRFQRRVNLGGGTGLNLSKSGIGASVRGRHGAIGSKGFSLRTGIPGLSFRQGWGGKRGDGAAVMLILGLVALTTAVVVVLIQAVVWLVPALWQAGRWCVLTVQDYISYRRTGIQPDGDMTPIAQEKAASLDGPPEKTLAEILAEQANPPALHLPPTSLPDPGPATARTVMSPPAANVVQPATTNHAGLIVAGAVVLGLVLLVSMCSRLGSRNANSPEFKASDAQAWRATMLNDKQPASTRLSNAKAIIEHFPDSPDASLASTMTQQLEQASVVESVEAAQTTAAREEERQALIDRKERRDPAPPSRGASSAGGTSSTGHTGELAAVGAAATLAAQASSKPARTAPRPKKRSAPAAASTKRSRSRPIVQDGACPCSGSFNCTGPRGGQYCFTSNGNKRYR